MRRKVIVIVIVAKLGVGVALFGKGTWIYAKAHLAQHLIEHAWERTLAGERQVRPWPWADTWPVARLYAPRHNADLYVLAGSSGSSLAFGPGHLDGSALPGEPGNCVISAHRDTQFGFLRRAQAGDELFVETAAGTVCRYLVTEHRIVHERETSVLDPVFGHRLTLITCYPFDAVMPGGPLRYVVTAEAAQAVRGS